MRYLIDTNIFVYLSTDVECLSKDVAAIIQEPETLLYISAESIRELIVAYRNKGLCSKRWKSAEAMIVAIEKEFYVKILPLKKEHMQTYAHMEINEAQGHKDPSVSSVFFPLPPSGRPSTRYVPHGSPPSTDWTGPAPAPPRPKASASSRTNS